MWPDMVEFRSASSEIRGRKEEEEEEEDETLVKYKSANNYVGRPKTETDEHRKSETGHM